MHNNKPINANSLPEILRFYFATWESYNKDQLAQLFSKDALYEINGQVRFNGIKSILKYWKQNSEEQELLRWSVSEVDEFASAIIASWQATFRRKDKGVWYSLEGLMWLRLHEGQVIHLNESFRKRASRREPCLKTKVF